MQLRAAPPGLPAGPAAALRVVRALAVSGVVTVLVVLCLTAAGEPRRTQDGRSATADAYRQVVAQVLHRHRCSARGFGPRDRPASALIRTEQGRLAVVPLGRGRAVYRGARPGTLMAVCLDGPRAVRAGVDRVHLVAPVARTVRD